MSRSLIYGLLAVLLCSWGSTDIPNFARKKVEKKIEWVWPDLPVVYHQEASDFLTDDETLYVLLGGNDVIGYFILDKAMSKYDYFDYMVMFDTTGTILTTSILVYREDYGGEIASPRWLKQFIGHSFKDDLTLDKDISGISGATISCQSAVAGIKDLTQKIASIIETK